MSETKEADDARRCLRACLGGAPVIPGGTATPPCRAEDVTAFSGAAAEGTGKGPPAAVELFKGRGRIRAHKRRAADAEAGY